MTVSNLATTKFWQTKIPASELCCYYYSTKHKQSSVSYLVRACWKLKHTLEQTCCISRNISRRGFLHLLGGRWLSWIYWCKILKLTHQVHLLNNHLSQFKLKLFIYLHWYIIWSINSKLFFLLQFVGISMSIKNMNLPTLTLLALNSYHWIGSV